MIRFHNSGMLTYCNMLSIDFEIHINSGRSYQTMKEDAHYDARRVQTIARTAVLNNEKKVDIIKRIIDLELKRGNDDDKYARY